MWCTNLCVPTLSWVTIKIKQKYYIQQLQFAKPSSTNIILPTTCIMIPVFWDATPCSMAERYLYFRQTYYQLLQHWHCRDTLDLPEMLVSIYQTTWYQNPDRHNCNTQAYKNLMLLWYHNCLNTRQPHTYNNTDNHKFSGKFLQKTHWMLNYVPSPPPHTHTHTFMHAHKHTHKLCVISGFCS